MKHISFANSQSIWSSTKCGHTAELLKEHKIYAKYFQSEDHLTQHCNGVLSKLPPDELLQNTAENLANKRDFPTNGIFTRIEYSLLRTNV